MSLYSGEYISKSEIERRESLEANPGTTTFISIMVVVIMGIATAGLFFVFIAIYEGFKSWDKSKPTKPTRGK